MRAFLVGASPGTSPEGTAPYLARALKAWKADPGRDLFIGVDGGVLAWLEAGFKPHLAVGDWDSFRGVGAKRVLRALHHITLPRRKDRSDLHFAAQAVLSAGATQLIALGVTGGRPDHHLAALLDLAWIAGGREGDVKEVSAHGTEGDYHFVTPRICKLNGGSWQAPSAKRARLASVFALSGPASGVSLQGFEYPLRGARLAPSSHGLSNRILGSGAKVSVKAGCLLVLLPA